MSSSDGAYPHDAPMPEFICEYGYRGHRWGFTIHALDHADAQARLATIAGVGGSVVMGQLMAVIPAGVPGAGWFVRLWCGVRNLLRRTGA